MAVAEAANPADEELDGAIIRLHARWSDCT